MVYAGDKNMGVIRLLMIVEVIGVDDISQEKYIELKSKGPRKNPAYSNTKGSDRGKRSRKRDWEVTI